MKKFFVTLILAALVSACSNDKLPDFNKLDKLRIIALEVNTPEVNPGATVTVTPWISDISETTGLSDTVIVCVDPGWCKTDMGTAEAPLTANDGANRIRDAIWLK